MMGTGRVLADKDDGQGKLDDISAKANDLLTIANSFAYMNLPFELNWCEDNLEEEATKVKECMNRIIELVDYGKQHLENIFVEESNLFAKINGLYSPATISDSLMIIQEEALAAQLDEVSRTILEDYHFPYESYVEVGYSLDLIEAVLATTGLTLETYERMSSRDKEKLYDLMVNNDTSGIKTLLEIYDRPTIEELFPIEANLEGKATQVRIDGNDVYIDFYVKYEGDGVYDNYIDNTITDRPGDSIDDRDTGISTSTLLTEGLVDNISMNLLGSDYDFLNGVEGEVICNVYVHEDNYLVDSSLPFKAYDDNQEFITINIPGTAGRSFARRDSNTWKPGTSGYIELYFQSDTSLNYKSEEAARDTITHECLHLLGIGDSYEEYDGKGFTGAEQTIELGQSKDIMSSTWNGSGAVNANHIELVLAAYSTGEWQNLQAIQQGSVIGNIGMSDNEDNDVSYVIRE